MKKSIYSYTHSKKSEQTDQNNNILKGKTTNINILLNRVRLDKKKTLKRKIFFSSLLVLSVSLIIALVII